MMTRIWKRLRSVPNGLAVAALVLVCSRGLYAQAGDDGAARAAMGRGNKAMQMQDFGTAVAAFSEFTRRMPEFAEGYFNLGLALEQQGEPDKAAAALTKALELKPGLHGANLFQGIIAYRQNRYKQAEESVEKETRLSPRDAQAFMWLGVCRLAASDPQDAIAPLEKAHALDPKNVDILYHRGRAYLEMANQSYAAMYKQDRDSGRVHQVLAEAYASGYRNQEAIGEYELTVQIAPWQPGLHEDLADQYWITGQIDKAEEGYRQELQIDPYAVTAMFKLGSLLVLHDKPEEGVQLLRNALRADSSLSDARYYLGTGLAALDKNEDAVHEFEAAIAADPNADRAMSSYYKLAQVYRKLHKGDEARAALENFQRMRAEVKSQQESRATHLVRNRAELPVADPENSADVAKQ
jgi:tetratricopeptide (TPR) repeat protein